MSAGSPGPVSATLTSIRPTSWGAVARVISRRGLPSIASAALRIRFTSTCWIWTRSIRTKRAPGSTPLDDLDAAVTAVRKSQGHGFVQHRPDIHGEAGQFAFGDEVAQALDDLAGAQDLLARLVDQSRRPAPVDDGQALGCAEIVGCCR